MASSRKIPSHDKNSFTDRQSAALVKSIFAAHGRVAEDIKTDDKWPNTDGTIDIQDVVQETTKDTAEIIAKFAVQVKTLSETGKLKFPCDVGLLEYCRKLENVLLLVADNEAKKVYWLYLDPDTVDEIDDGANTTSVTLALKEDQSFSLDDDSYIDKWVKLFADNRNRVSALEDRINNALESQIDVAKQLLEKYQYTDALRHLMELKEEQWDQANDHARFRIISNIAAAKAHIGDMDEAAKDFLDGYEFQPELPKAQTNKAIAHLLKDEYQEALDQADMVLKANPIDLSATSTKIQALTHFGKSLEDIKASIDKSTMEDAQVAYVLHLAAKQAGQGDISMTYLEKAVEADQDNPFYRADLGINILDSVISNDPTAVKGMLNPEQTEKVKRSIALLQKAWQDLPDVQVRKLNAVWLFDLAMAYRLIRLDCDAEKTNEELLGIDPNNEAYVKNAAVIAFESKKPEVAEAYCRQLIDDGSKLPEVKVMLVDALRAQSKNEEALKLADEFLTAYPERDDLYADMAENLYDIHILNQDLEKAQALTDQLLSDTATSLVGSLFAARLARIKQDAESASRFLEKAESEVTDKTYKKQVIDLAEEAYYSGAYEIAARSYERVLKPSIENQFTQRYLKSLYETGRYKKIIEIAESIREANGSSRYITQFEWGSYLELQDLANARRILELYIKEHPEDEDARLSVAIIYLRSNDLKALDEYLASDIKLENLDLLPEVQLANLYQNRGNSKRTLEIIYDARRRNMDSADAHSAYISVFLGLEPGISKIVNVKTIEANTALIYEGGNFIIEDVYEPQISNNEISVKSAEERGFIGKKKGDSIVLNQNHLTGKNETKILEVQSKYVFALQDSMKNFERRFSDRHDLMSFSVEDNDFSPLFKQLDERQQQTQNIEQLYKEGKLTIDLFAKFVGRNLIEVFYALRGAPDLGIRVALGTVEESSVVQKTLENLEGSKLVADITALITFFELGLKPSDIGVEKFVIAQRTSDLILTLVTELESVGRKKTMTLYKSGGQYIRQEITAREQQQRRTAMKKFAKWVKANTAIEALTQEQIDAINSMSKMPEKLDDLIDGAQLDTIKLAVGEDRILYSDDVGLRGLSMSTYRVKGVWTQALLAHQCDAREITVEDYEDFTIQLIGQNYHHVAISPQVLLHAARLTGGQPKEPLLGTLKTLSRPETNPASMVIVLVNFLYEFYKQPVATNKIHVIQQILNEATRHHDKQQFIALLRKGLAIRFELSPLHLQEIEDTISAWLTLHDA